MAEDWDFYMCPVDDRPASIFVDLGLMSSAPDASRPWLLRVSVEMRIPREDGLSDQEETDVLYEIEDALFAQVAQSLRARYVGRITGSGNRDLFYYAATATGFEEVVGKAMEQFPQYEFDCSIREDPDWETYCELLYPSDLDMQSIQNRRLVDQMIEHGDDITQSRDVDHWIYFPSEEARERMIRQVEPEGFRCERTDTEEPDAEYRFGLHLVRRDRVDLDSVDPLVIDLFLRAQNCGGEYDGWGAVVVKPGS